MALVTAASHVFDVDAVLFDLDGTLVNTLGDFTEALNAMLVELNLSSISPSVVSRFVGKGSEYLVDCTIKHALTHMSTGHSATEIEAMCGRAQPVYQRHYGLVNGLYSHCYEGAREGLNAVDASGLPMVCVTNKPTAYAKELLRQLDLLSVFTHVFGGDAFERKKPDPLPLLRCCEALGTLPERTLMVGDSANDAQAARAAKCPVLLVTYGYNHGQPARDVNADDWVDSLRTLSVQG